METTADGVHYVDEKEGREYDKITSPFKAFNETGKAFHRTHVGEADGKVC
jgi:hypothetical protein